MNVTVRPVLVRFSIVAFNWRKQEADYYYEKLTNSAKALIKQFQPDNPEQFLPDHKKLCEY